MSDTPRTDAEEYTTYAEGGTLVVDPNFTRQLEKELNATTAELERTREQLRVAREALERVCRAW